jgi:hypothetical protein
MTTKPVRHLRPRVWKYAWRNYIFAGKADLCEHSWYFDGLMVCFESGAALGEAWLELRTRSKEVEADHRRWEEAQKDVKDEATERDFRQRMSDMKSVLHRQKSEAIERGEGLL